MWTDQSVQQLQLQWGYTAAELGGKGARLLATFQQLKQGSIHIQGLSRPGTKAFKIKYGWAEKSDLQEAQHTDHLCRAAGLGDSAGSPFYLAGALILSGHNCTSLSDCHLKVLQNWGQCWIGSPCPL